MWRTARRRLTQSHPHGRSSFSTLRRNKTSTLCHMRYRLRTSPVRRQKGMTHMPGLLNAVVDISHHNGNVNLVKAKADGILGVIQKATQGQSGKDPTFKTNRTKANDA